MFLKFPKYICTVFMKEKILHIASEMFLSLGFKSITMDDIAREIGVSKKTIYSHFKNKTELVIGVTDAMFCTICDGVNLIHEQQKNPIIELFEVKRFIMLKLKDEKSSPQYQLQKYYPKIFATLKQDQFEFMQNCIKGNLQRGIDLGLFRKTIDIEFISRLYFNGIMGIKDRGLFPLQHFSQNELMDYYLEYHLRGISTQKGIEILETELKN